MRALDSNAQRAISKLGRADILVGISSYNSAETVSSVVTHSADGLSEYFPESRSVIFVSDGGSTDGALDVVNAIRLPRRVSLVASRYRGISGKGSAVRAIFEAAVMLGATSVAMVDSDLRSMTPSWIKLLIGPTTRQVGLVAPRYERHKYDGTITNQLCYPLTRALYGKRIRQPIGGDFGLSAGLVQTLLASGLWETPFILRFGIDIFITSTALASGFPVEEADLGAKIHDSKDPALQLGSMFREVAGSALLCMEEYEESWKKVTSSFSVPIHRNSVCRTKPPPVHASLSRLIEEAKAAYSRSEYFKSAIPVGLRHELDSQLSDASSDLEITTDAWAKTVYEVCAKFKRSDEARRVPLLEGLRAIWVARVATFVKQTTSMSDEEAEQKVQDDAARFEEMKNELVTIY